MLEEELIHAIDLRIRASRITMGLLKYPIHLLGFELPKDYQPHLSLDNLQLSSKVQEELHRSRPEYVLHLAMLLECNIAKCPRHNQYKPNGHWLVPSSEQLNQLEKYPFLTTQQPCPYC